MTADTVVCDRLVVSVVSHGQADLVTRLCADLAAFCQTPLHLVITINRPETLPEPVAPFPVTIIRNARARGFAENHNAAAVAVPSDVFCVVNPDLRLTHDPFPALMAALKDPAVGVAAPRVVGSGGAEEDSARVFPTPLGALRRLVKGGTPGDCARVEWVAGMFMAFRSATFAAVGGFDPRYHLYYEDCDLCCRLVLAGYSVVRVPAAVVVHDAQRASHRRPRYFLWHVQSALRFFRSQAYRQLRSRAQSGAR